MQSLPLVGMQAKLGKLPRVFIMGARGRCGGAASECCRLSGLAVTGWDMEETAGRVSGIDRL